MNENGRQCLSPKTVGNTIYYCDRREGHDGEHHWGFMPTGAEAEEANRMHVELLLSEIQRYRSAWLGQMGQDLAKEFVRLKELSDSIRTCSVCNQSWINDNANCPFCVGKDVAMELYRMRYHTGGLLAADEAISKARKLGWIKFN